MTGFVVALLLLVVVVVHVECQKRTIDGFGCINGETRPSDRTHGICTNSASRNLRYRRNHGTCQDGELRLVGGQTSSEGRLEVCLNEVWGTVCDDFWSTNDASVACKQLGYSRHNTISAGGLFGKGTGPILLDNVDCTSSEDRLIDCNYDSHTADCGHREDVGLRCDANLVCQEGELRLVGGQTSSEGRLEVCLNEVWGTVCDDFWSTNDASVACKQLGYSIHSTYSLGGLFGRGTGPILMDDVGCTSSEERLIDCVYDSRTSDCNHGEDVGLRCIETVTCQDGELRLVGGETSSEGRLEVCLNEVWGTVCDDFWSTNDASVACRQLGYSRHNTISSGGLFGRGTGPILLDNVGCTSSEDRLIDCNYDPDGTDCNHGEDVGLRCNPTFVCQEGDIRLVGGQTSSEGRLEVCLNEVWGTVCDDLWSTNDARVACRQLGFSEQNTYSLGGLFGRGTGPILMDDVGCTSSEERLIDCDYDSRTSDCNHGEDVGLRCTTTIVCQEGDIRLVGGQASSEGRLEVCLNGVWGTVCDDHWSGSDASVACKQLGFSRHNTSFSAGLFGQGTGPILLDNVGCTSSERRLIDCNYDSHTADCNHGEDVGLICDPDFICENGELRLVGGSTNLEGRLEVCWNETWGTVCDGFWSTSDAKVACRQLGFSTRSGSYTAYSNAHFGEGEGPILLDDLICTGSESRLIDCSHEPIGQYDFCTHNDDAGLRCEELLCSNGDLRLVGGSSIYEGRVELCWEERWGTVCDDSWDDREAAVVCNQLGLISQNNNPQSFRRAAFGYASSSVPILLDDMKCLGNETSLIGCSFRKPIGSHNCYHAEDAGVRCPQCTENSIRLVDGSTPYEGRVEVCLSGQWGTVCDDGWGEKEAKVVCRQLGYPTSGFTAFQNAYFGSGTIPILLDNLLCLGTETQLASCTHSGVGNIGSCSHSEDAGVRCKKPLPGPPRSVSATVINDTSLKVTWKPPLLSDSYGEIIDYNLKIYTGDMLRFSLTYLSNASRIFVFDFEPYTSYRCCVRAANALGSGAQRCNSITTPEAAPSGPPLSLSGYSPSSTSIRVTWNRPASGLINGILRRYRIRVTETMTGQISLYSTTLHYKTIYSLHPFYNYSCEVAAYTVGLGPYSDAVSIVTQEDEPSGPPQYVLIAVLGARSATMNWSPPVFNKQNGIVTGYTVTLRAVRGNIPLLFLATTAHTFQYTFTSLRPHTSYSCSVAANTSVGIGPFSSAVQFQTNSSVPATSPLSFQGNIIDSRMLHLSWDPPLASDQNGDIIGYTVKLIGLETGKTNLVNSVSTSVTVSSLHPFYTYKCSVAARTSAGLGPFTNPALSIKMPTDRPSSAPRNFRNISITSRSVKLSWNSIPTEDRNGDIIGYVIQMTFYLPGESQHVISRTTSLNQIIVRGLNPYTSYVSTVAAKTSAGSGPLSSSLTVKTNEDVPTSAPEDFTVTAYSHSLHLMWSPPPVQHQNGKIRHYRVSTTEVETGSTKALNHTDVSLTLSNLHPYYHYELSVAAYTVGLGPSAVYSARTNEYVPSGYPRNLTAMAVSSTSISVTWKPLAPEDQNGIITGYVLNVISLKSRETVDVSVQNSTLQTSVDGLTPYTTYIISIAATTSVGQGPFSPVTTVNTPEDVPSHMPLNLKARALSSSSIHLSWTPPPQEHHNGIIREYRINITEEETGDEFRYSVDANETELTVSGLHPFYSYNCTVVAVTIAEGPYSAVIGVKTKEAAPSAYPSSILADVVSAYMVRVSWSPPPSEARNGIIRRYEIVITDKDSSPKTFLSYKTSFLLENVRPFTTYSIKVAAVTVAPGPYSPEISIQTPPANVSGPPLNLMADVVDSKTAVLSWDPPLKEKRNGIIRSYTIHVTDKLIHENTTYSSDTTNLVLTSLRPYSVYLFTVAAHTTSFPGPYSSPFQFQMPEGAPAGVPQNLEVSDISSTGALLTWQPPELELRNGIIRQYNISMVEMYSGKITSHMSLQNWTTLDGLHPYYTYSVAVAAETISAGPFTNNVTFTTLQAPPSGPPQELEVETVTSNSISLKWKPPAFSLQNGIISSYVVKLTEEKTRINSTYSTTDTHMTIESLNPSSIYSCYVAAENSAGQGPYSPKLEVELQNDVPSSMPLNFEAIIIDSDTVTFSWDPPLDSDQNGDIIGYSVKLIGLETGETNLVNSVSTSVTVSSLHPFYTYNCSVAAGTSAGLGPYSNPPLSIKMPTDTPSGPPLELNSTIVSNSTISLFWNPPQLLHQNGIITGYAIKLISSAVVDSYTFNVGSNTLSYRIANLKPFTSYTISIAAQTSVGIGPFSDPITVETSEAAPASAPRNFEVIVYSSSVLLLSWDNPPAQDHNGVIRKYSIKILEVETGKSLHLASYKTSIRVADLHPYYLYNCSVAAYTVADGPYTEHVAARTEEDFPSGYPRNLTAMAVSSTGISLTWKPLAPEDQNGVITGYVLNVMSLKSKETVEVSVLNSTLQTSVNRLTPYSTYVINIAATTSVGQGPFSPVTTVNTPEDVPSHMPLNLKGRALSSSSIHLSWTPPPQEHHNGIIREYRINITEEETGDEFRYSVDANETELTVSGLHPFYSYNCTVVAVTIAEGPYSAVIGVKTNEAAPSAAPTDLMAVVQEPNILQLSWSPPNDGYINGIIRAYKVIINGTDFFLTVASQMETINVTGLKFYTVFHVRVAAETIARGPFSLPVEFKTNEAPPDGTPLNLTVEFVDPQTLALSWDPPVEREKNGIIRGYTIRVTDSLTGIFTEHTSNTTYTTITSLQPYSVYLLTVAAITIAQGPFAKQLTVQMPEDGPYSAPTNFEVIAYSSTALFLTWDNPPATDLNGVIRKYNVRILEVETGKTLQLTSNKTSIRVTDLHPYYLYNCSVAAYTVADGPYTEHVAARTLEDNPSGYPENLTAVIVSSVSVNLFWNPVAPDEQNGIITGYVLSVRSGEMLDITVLNSTLKTSLDGLTPYSTYIISIAATTSVGIGPFSPVTTINTPEDAPDGPPLNLIANVIDSKTAVLSWDPPLKEKRNGIIRSYTIHVTDSMMNENITYISDTTNLTLISLRPYSVYLCAVAALTISEGPFTEPFIIQTPEDVPNGSPTVSNIMRLDAGSIFLSWDPLPTVMSNGVVTNYFIRYRSISSEGSARYHRDSSEEEYMVTSTTGLQVTIENLDPRLTYSIGVAASNQAGIGSYSDGTIVGLYENSPFQLFLSGFVICSEWVSHSAAEKSHEIASYVAKGLLQHCKCSVSLQHVADGRLLCDSSYPHWVIFSSIVIGSKATSVTSTELVSSIQQWTATKPTVSTKGVQMEVLSNCSVVLSSGSMPSCVPVHSKPTDPMPSNAVPVTTSELPTSVDTEQQSGGAISNTIVFISVAGGGVLLVIIIVVVIINVIVCKKRSKSPAQSNIPAILTKSVSYRPRPPEVIESCNSVDSKLNSSTTDEHIYDYIAQGDREGDSNKAACADASVPEYKNIQPDYSTLDRTIPGRFDSELSSVPQINPFNPYSSPQEYSANPFNPYSSPPSRQCMPQLESSTEYVEMKGVTLNLHDEN